MNLTEEQKEIIKSGVENFDEKFIAIKNEWRSMGYEEDECNELTWTSFVLLKADVHQKITRNIMRL